MAVLAILPEVIGQPVNQLIGTNIRREDPFQYLDFAGFVREYHDWVIDEGDYSAYVQSPFVLEPSLPYPCNEFRWNPPYQSQTSEHFDQFYENILGNCNGCQIVSVLKGAIPYLAGGNGTANMEFMPVKTNFIGAPRVEIAEIIHPTGMSDGTITLLSCGGIEPFEYSVDGALTFQSSPIFTGLDAGIYTIFVRENSITRTNNGLMLLILNDEGAPTVNAATTNITPTTCGQNDGGITAMANGGTPPFEYSVNGSNWQLQNNFQDLPSGRHTLRVRGSDGRTTFFQFIINSSSSLTANVNVTQKPTGGGSNGVLEVFANGGAGSYQYSLNGSMWQSNEVFTGINANLHNIRVQDADGCQFTIEFIVNGATETNPPGGYQFESPTTDPASYIEFADWAYQYTLRYGNTPYSPFPEQAKFHHSETQETGLGAVQYIEIWNEEDKDWFGGLNPFITFSEQDYAALFSAAFDGNKDAMKGVKPNSQFYPASQGYDIGVNNADPGMNIVMGGLSEFAADDWAYLVGIRDALLSLRGNDINNMFNVINFHHYCDNVWTGVNAAGSGVSPEEDNNGGVTFKKRMVELKSLVESEFGGAKLWLSEFGWDTNANSPQRAPIISGNGEVASSQEVQGRWIVRAFMEVAAAGWDRAMQFDIRDSNSSNTPASGGLFDASGLVKDKASGYAPKKSYYYTCTLANVLGSKEFCQEINAFDETNNYQYDVNLRYTITPQRPRVYLFKNGGGCDLETLANLQSGDIMAVWFPTSVNQSNPEYELHLENLAPGLGTATLIKMVELDKDGVREDLTILTAQGNGQNQCSDPPCLKIPVSERPVFIQLGPGAPNPDLSLLCPANLSAETVSCDAIGLAWDTPMGLAIDYYKIYYYEKNDSEEGGTPPAFDISDPNFILYADNLPASTCNQVTLGGLNIMDDQYWIYVVAVVEEEINGITFYHNSDPDCGRVAAKTGLCFGGVGMNDILQMTENNDPAIQGMFNQNGLDFCYPQREPITGGWDFFDYSNNATTNSVILTLPEDYNIFAISIFDGAGVGNFSVEYSPDETGNNWIEIFGLDPYLTSYFEEWKTFPFCSASGVRRLRCTKDAMANIRRIVLYGHPTTGPIQLECCGSSEAIVLNNANIADEIGNTLLPNYQDMQGAEFVIHGTLTVNDNYGFSDANVIMMPGSKILIDPLHTFTVEQSTTIQGCEQMWEGIVLSPQSELTFSSSTLRDAMYGINMIRGAGQFPQIRLFVSGSVFEQNYIGINVPYNYHGKDVSTLSFVVGSTFDGNGADLKAPYSGQPAYWNKSFTGINLNNLNLFTIGNQGSTNLFQRLEAFGISSQNTNLNVSNSMFKDMPGISNWTGAGIFFTSGRLVQTGLGKGLLSEDEPITQDPSVPSTFDNVQWPIQMHFSSFDISKNKALNCPNGVFGRVNRPNENNTINDNYLNIRGPGIYMRDFGYPFVTVEKNVIENYTDKRGDGIYLSSFSSLPQQMHSIQNNKIRVGFGANSAGIRVLGAQSALVENNIVTLTGFDQADDKSTYGIYAANADGVVIRTNNVKSNGSPLVISDCFGVEGVPDCEEDILGAFNPTFGYCSSGSDGIPDCENDCDGDGTPNWADCSTNATGIFVLSSDLHTVQCNKVDRTVTGIAFAEPCVSDEGIRGNMMGELGTGLWLRDGTITGIQTDKGNAWEQPFGSYLAKAARHWSVNLNDWEDSQFYVLSGNNMFNPSSGNSQTGFFISPEIADGIWFDESGSSPFVCPELPPCLDGGHGGQLEGEECNPRDIRRQDNFDLDGTYRRIISDGLGTTDMKPASQWNLDKHLYAGIKEEYPDQITDNTLAGFAQNNASNSIGQFNGIETGIAQLSILDTVKLQELEDIQLDLQAYMDLQAPIVESISSMGVTGLKVWLQNNAGAGIPPEDYILEVSQIDSALLAGKHAQVMALIAANNAVYVAQDYEGYEATMNNTFLNTVGQDVDTLNSTQLSTVKMIAALCPSEGGEAVFKARYLYNALVDPRPLPEWDSCYGLKDQFSSRSSGKSDEIGKMKTTKGAVVFPNPASESLTLLTDGSATKWQLCDFTGIIIKEGDVLSNKQVVSVSGIPSGMYFILINQDKHQVQAIKVLIIN